MKKSEPINVTKTFLPPIREYEEYLKYIWSSNQLTNNGSLSKEFVREASAYLDVEAGNFTYVTNGTLALQIALRALDITEGEVVTTPFSYVATTSAILWEKLTPVYTDIDPDTLNIDPTKIEALITPKTKAILAVHVFGNPCDVEAIQEIAGRHRLKVIYDTAHGFGVKYKNKSILSYGDVSTLSFHATKLFHTIEGGAIYAKDQKVSEKAELLKRFGHNGDEHFALGINAKATEFQAAMGLCNLNYIDDIIRKRRDLSLLYDELLNGVVGCQKMQPETIYNYGYYPVILKNDKELKRVITNLNKRNIYPRRYFYPSLNKLPYLNRPKSCPISEDVASRILCLPLYDSLEEAIIKEICEVIST